MSRRRVNCGRVTPKGVPLPVAMRRALTLQGCTCAPTATRLPADRLPATAGPNAVGYLIDHQAGCLIGDAVIEHNERGVIPYTQHTAEGMRWHDFD